MPVIVYLLQVLHLFIWYWQLTCTLSINKSFNGPGNSMVTVLHKNFLAEWRNFIVTSVLDMPVIVYLLQVLHLFIWYWQLTCTLTINKSFNGSGNSMVTVLHKNFLAEWRTFIVTVHGLNPLQLPREKQKSSVEQGFTWCFKISFLECSYNMIK